MSSGYYKTSTQKKKIVTKKLDRLQYLGRSKVARSLLVSKNAAMYLIPSSKGWESLVIMFRPLMQMLSNIEQFGQKNQN
jgi:hypothetical protein